MSDYLNNVDMKNGRNGRKSSSEDSAAWDDEEAHFSGHPPPSPANRRTSRILPPLVQPTSGAMDPKKAAQPVALPELVQRPLDGRRLDLAPGQEAKQRAPLPKIIRGQRMRRGTALPVSGEPDAPTPLDPELADERFCFLWENRRQTGKTLTESLALLDEREVLSTILASIRQPVQHPSAAEQNMAGLQNGQLFHNQIRLYRYCGLKLRQAQRRDAIAERLRMLLRSSQGPGANREGIAEAFSVAAFGHLDEVVAALRDFSRLLNARKYLACEASEEKRENTERRMRATLLLCCGQAASGAEAEELLQVVGLVMAEVLCQFRAQKKDEELKRLFLRTAGTIARAVVRTGREEAEFPLKAETAVCITEIIEEEPSSAINNLHQALLTVSSMACVKPPLEPGVSSDLVGSATRKVFSLPFLRGARGKAGGPRSRHRSTFSRPSRPASAC